MKISEKLQFTIKNRLVSIAAVQIKNKIQFVCCVRSLGDSAKECSDQILTGRAIKKKFLTTYVGEPIVTFVPNDFEFTHELLLGMKQALMSNFTFFYKFNSTITEPGKRNSFVLKDKTIIGNLKVQLS